MTATQSLKIYEILHRHFKSDADAKSVVEEIEIIIDNKFEKEKNLLATKEDIFRLEKLILQNQAEIEKRFTTTIVIIISIISAVVGIAVAIIKL
jgi:hypothetical protein